jgi:2-methylcitrate dehydratase PrpD
MASSSSRSTTTSPEQRQEFTRQLAQVAAGFDAGSIPRSSQQRAKHCLLDWLGVTIAAADEPGVAALRETVVGAGEGESTVVGSPVGADALTAALVNGTAGHYLDFDDVSSLMRGHPTAPVAPALIALAERDGHDGRSVLAAFVAGLEVQGRLGEALANPHYAAGFHTTGTLGAFGAAAACSHLLGLDERRCQLALGIAAAQAAGLRAMFGTMAKALHVGKAAYNGLLAAELARRDFTANPAAIEAEAGFAASAVPGLDPVALNLAPGGTLAVDNIAFKLYPACYGTHSAIEGARRLREENEFATDEIESVRVDLRSDLLSICNVQNPVTPMEAKFSTRFVTAVALSGGDLSEGGFTPEAILSPKLAALVERIVVQPMPRDGAPGNASAVEVRLRGSRTVRAEVRVGIPVPDDELAIQRDRVSTKFRELAGPSLGEEAAEAAIEAILELDEAAYVDGLSLALGGA